MSGGEVEPLDRNRLIRREVVLDGDYRVGVAIGGGGRRPPVVLVHGFSAEGFLYAQTLSRLVRLGFKVIAIDVAGHGATPGLTSGGRDLPSYTWLVARVLDKLGVRRAVLAGHSMGGRIVAQLAAAEPGRALAVVLIDAAVGDAWDRLMRVSRLAPPVLVGLGAALFLDGLSTLLWVRNPGQAAKLARLAAPTLRGNARHPMRLVDPAVAMLRSPGSRRMLETLAAEGVPVVVIHGDRDLAVPYRTARDAARSARATLVTIHGGTHSWVLKDPETLPAVIAELLDGPLGGIPVKAPAAQPSRRPRYRWSVQEPAAEGPVTTGGAAASSDVGESAGSL